MSILRNGHVALSILGVKAHCLARLSTQFEPQRSDANSLSTRGLVGKYLILGLALFILTLRDDR